MASLKAIKAHHRYLHSREGAHIHIALTERRGFIALKCTAASGIETENSNHKKDKSVGISCL
jgi:hypothetical protein